MRVLHKNNHWEPYEDLLRTRQDQYNRFRTIAPDFVFKPGAPKQTYTDNVLHHPAAQYSVTYCRRHGNVIIDILESVDRTKMAAADVLTYRKSKGGSSLFARAENKCSVALCTYVDYFNGAYSVICPLFSPTVKIKVAVLQTNFQQFRGVMKSVNHVLLDTDFELTREELNHTVALPDAGFERWTTNWKCREVVTSALCDIVARIERLYLIGASHMRYQYHYLLVTCKTRIPEINRRLYYIDASYGDDVADVLSHLSSQNAPNDCSTEFKSNLDAKTMAARFKEHIPTNSSMQIFTFRRTFSRINPELEKGHKINDTMKMGFCSSDPDMRIGIIAQSGSWDLSFLGLDTSLNEVFPVLDEALGAVSRTIGSMDHIKLLVMGPPAFNPTYYRSGRSNGEIQLYTAAMGDISEKHGLRFFNTFKALYPSFSDSVDSHYLRCDYEKDPICYGEHGMIVFHDALHTLTQQFDTT